jgi:hypothetical protein
VVEEWKWRKPSNPGVRAWSHDVGRRAVVERAALADRPWRRRLPVRREPRRHRARHADLFGWLGTFLAFDVLASSTLTRELVGWQPTGPGLIDDLEQGHYFREPVRAGA